MNQPTQSPDGGRSFPPRKTSGFGEMGSEIEINTQAPHGNQKFVQTGFKANAGQATTSHSASAPHECNTRDIRIGDPGPGFGNSSALPPLEIAGASRSLPKKFLSGGKSH